MSPDQQLLLKIEGHAQILLGYLSVCQTYTAFSINEPMRSAAVLHLLQIGELVNKLTDSMRTQNSHIDWRGLIGLRNIVAHRYGDLNYERVWDVLVNEINPLVQWLVQRQVY
jgi:uncharacterized protein with HEPN domain